MAELRRELPQRFPQLTFYFQPADIVSQILNFGLPAPIDIQIAGIDRAEELRDGHRDRRATSGRSPASLDVHLHQVMNVPKLHVEVDQTRARELGLTQQDVANSVLVSLSGSGQVQPNYWVDPNNGISYLVETRTPTYKLDSVDAINGLPLDVAAASGRRSCWRTSPTIERGVDAGGGQPLQRAAGLRRLRQRAGPRPGQRGPRDQPACSTSIAAKLAPGNTITMRGQVESMESAFLRLGLGHRVRRGAGLPADGRELPELARPVHHHHGLAGRAGRHRLDRCSCGTRRSACRA